MKTLSVASAVALALSTNSMMVQAEESTNTFETMVVTATNHEVSADEAPASISIISNEELNKIPATDITTALENVVGLHISKSSASEPKIIIRGLHNQNSSNGNYTLLLVNGHRVSSSETIIRGAGFDLSSIPMSAIDHIEVVRGPMSSLYGSEAIGGVVNVILKQPTSDTQIAGSVDYTQPEEGDGTTKNMNVYVSGANQDSDLFYSVAADASHKESWFPDDAGSNFTPQASQKRKGINTNLTWLATDSDTVTFGLGYMDDDRTFPDASDSDYDTQYESQKLTASIGHEKEWAWGDSDLQYFYENSKVYEDHWHPLIGEGEMTQTNHNLTGKTIIPLNENHLLTSGLDFYSSSIENSRNYSSTKTAKQAAVYAQDEYQALDDVMLTLSGRYTHHDTFGSNFSPRAYLVWNTTDRLTLKGGYGEGFKAPTIFQSSSDFSLISCGGSCYLIGNEDLKPQTSKSYEFSANYRSDEWYLQGTLFLNNIKNLIDRDLDNIVGYNDDDGIAQKQYTNVDKVRTQGLELEGSIDLSDSFSLTSNATYTKAENREDNSDISYTPTWLANTNLNWQASDKLSLFTGINYTGEQKDDSDNTLDSYSIVQLGGSYQVQDGLTVKMGISNLFDTRLDQDDDQDYEDTEVGRSYYLSVDFSL